MSTEAPKVAEWLVRQANSWLPAPCWAVVARDNSDRLTVMADSGLNPGLGPSLWSAVEWVMSHGDDLMSGDLSKDLRASGRGHGTVIALPLQCRGQVVGVLSMRDLLSEIVAHHERVIRDLEIERMAMMSGGSTY